MQSFLLASLSAVIFATEAQAAPDADDDAEEAARDAAAEVSVASGVPWTGFYFNANVPEASHKLLIYKGEVVVIWGSSLFTTRAMRRGKSIELRDGALLLDPPRKRGAPWTLIVNPLDPAMAAEVKATGGKLEELQPRLTQVMDPFLARLSAGFRGAHTFTRVDGRGNHMTDIVTVTDAFAVTIETDQNGVRSCHAGILDYDPLQDALTSALLKHLHPPSNEADRQAMLRRVFAVLPKPPQPPQGKGAGRGFTFSSRDTADCRSAPSGLDTLGLSGSAVLFADARGAPLGIRLRSDLDYFSPINGELFVADRRSLDEIRPLLKSRSNDEGAPRGAPRRP
jgi:hypothetical protein